MKFPALEAVEAQLKKIIDEAGPDLDLSRVKCIGGTPAQKVAKIRELNDEADQLRAAAAAVGGGYREPGDGARDLDGRIGGTGLDAAKRTLEAAVKSRGLPAEAAAQAEGLLKADTKTEQALAARWVTVTGDPNYLKAFAKLLSDPARGHMVWTDRERAAYQAAKGMQSELKAGSLTGNSELLPLDLDPSILLTSAGSINPLRQVSRVVRTISNEWKGVTSAGVSAEWKAEAAEATELTPPTDPAPVPVHFGDAWVPYSYEIGDDAAGGFVHDLGMLLTDAADQLQNTAFTTGSGSGQPTGIITALDGTSSEVAPTTVETFASADVYKVQNALPARFSARARWCAALPTINTMAQHETTNGARLFPELGTGRLLNRPIDELSNMKSTDDINAAVTADNHVLLYGDFTNFVIADRIGSTVEIIQNVVGTNGRPTGQRGVMLWFRTGSDVVVDNAFRVLNVATTL